MPNDKKPTTDKKPPASKPAQQPEGKAGAADAPKTVTALLEGTEGEATPKLKKKKVKRAIPRARVCVHADENNTIVTFTDLEGNVLGWSSAGASGFEGTRKSTPYAAKVAAENASLKIAQQYGIETVRVEVKGIGPGREQSLRGLQAAGLNLEAIVDVTPIPHGGCRRSRKRRV